MYRQVRLLALGKLDKLKLPWLERVKIARQFKVTEWLERDYAALIRSWGVIPLETLAENFGWEMAARLSNLAAKSQWPWDILHPNRCDKIWAFGTPTEAGSCKYTPKRLETGSHITFTCSRCGSEHTSNILRKGIEVPLYGETLTDAIKAAFSEDFN